MPYKDDLAAAYAQVESLKTHIKSLKKQKKATDKTPNKIVHRLKEAKYFVSKHRGFFFGIILFVLIVAMVSYVINMVDNMHDRHIAYCEKMCKEAHPEIKTMGVIEWAGGHSSNYIRECKCLSSKGMVGTPLYFSIDGI